MTHVDQLANAVYRFAHDWGSVAGKVARWIDVMVVSDLEDRADSFDVTRLRMQITHWASLNKCRPLNSSQIL
jgi:hypothetical protein